MELQGTQVTNGDKLKEIEEGKNVNILDMVKKYFTEGNLAYEVVGILPTETDYLYKVMGKYMGKVSEDTYAVWTCFNTSTQSMNCGHYGLNYKDALKFFTEGDKPKPIIPYNRLSELATKFKDFMFDGCNDEGVKEELINYLIEDLEMTDEELEYFGIKVPRYFKKAEVEVTFTIPVIMPQDCDERYDIDYEEYALDYIRSVGISDREINAYIDEENIEEDDLDRYSECYGYDEYDEY